MLTGCTKANGWKGFELKCFGMLGVETIHRAEYSLELSTL